MINLDYQTICFFVLITTLSGQLDGPCTFKLTNSPGLCKPLSDCSRLRDDLINYNRLPQTCGFQETQPIVCCPKESGEISKKKCKEYSVYGIENNFGSGECGHKIVKRIVRGVKASRKEFPHMAALGYENKNQTGDLTWLMWGGSIISERYILTVASAYSDSLGDPKYVKVGITDINDNDHKQEIKISEVIRHPDYSVTAYYNDIALVKLEKPIYLNSHARPACLYTKEEISTGKAIATGWGRIKGGGPPSNDLLKVTLDLVDHEVCNKSYEKFGWRRQLTYGIMKDSHLCAGSENEEKHNCKIFGGGEETGGPLQIYHTGDDISCMYDLVGITSFGSGCSGTPEVYTKISHYVKWIEDTVWPELKGK